MSGETVRRYYVPLSFDSFPTDVVRAADYDAALVRVKELEGVLKEAEDAYQACLPYAKRYDWLRNRCGEKDGKPYAVFWDGVSKCDPPLWNDILDVAVDAALAKGEANE